MDSISSAYSFSSEELEIDATDDAASVASPTLILQKHAKYYFNEANVQLLVEHVLYNVPRTILVRHSAWFRERFREPADCLPPGWDTHLTARGEYLFVNHGLRVIQDERPSAIPSRAPADAFCLHGISPAELDALLSVLCPDDYNDLQLTQVQWIAVLKLSTLYAFPSVRALAMRRLHPLLKQAPLERLIIARAYSVDEWVDEACRQLAEREQPLGEKEAARISLSDVVHIYMARESRARVYNVDKSGRRIEAQITHPKKTCVAEYGRDQSPQINAAVASPSVGPPSATSDVGPGSPVSAVSHSYTGDSRSSAALAQEDSPAAVRAEGLETVDAANSEGELAEPGRITASPQPSGQRETRFVWVNGPDHV